MRARVNSDGQQGREWLRCFGSFGPWTTNHVEVANEMGLSDLEETLKWGEPSYLTKHGSTLRIDWKEKAPDQYAMYFKCTSKLVPSFKAVYGDLFNYEKNRAIVFTVGEEIPKEALKESIRAALSYHKVKNTPFLGLGQ